jgi:hypothetical protein
LHVLLAALLLGFDARRRMNALQSESGPTSNDLLHELVARQSRTDVHGRIVAQSAEDVRDIEDAPAVSAEPVLSFHAGGVKR